MKGCRILEKVAKTSWRPIKKSQVLFLDASDRQTMDSIEFAEREYHRIMRTPETDYLKFPDREIKVWLNDSIVPLTESYSKRPAFRDQACWPLRVLVSGVNTPERQEVEAVDAALVASAKSLMTLAKNPLVARRLAALDRPTSRRVMTVDLKTGARPLVKFTKEESAPPQRILVENQVREIANHCWNDLVSAEDYFSPRRGMNFIDMQGRAQDGEFVVGFNPELHTVGDFVTRALLHRVDIWRSCLERYRHTCFEALSNVGRKYPRQVMNVNEAWANLEFRVTELQAHCTGEATTLRDSCIILTQVYAAFHPSPDLSWLGLSPTTLASEPSFLKHRILNQRDTETVERIARALGDLRALYPADGPHQSAIDEAIATGGLVLYLTRP